jgi:hypothetical protein
MDSLAGLRQVDDAKQAAQSDYSRAKPQQFHYRMPSKPPQGSREEAAKLM